MFFPIEVHEVIAHFLTEFPQSQEACKTEDYIYKFLARRYADEVAEDINKKYFNPICKILVEEYERRIEKKELLRYRFLDDVGERIAGIGKSWQHRLLIFQDALNEMTDGEFESLSARVLAILGCSQVWTTPHSHDQGLDAFGYADAFPDIVPREISNQCRIVCLAQAKHYKKHKVGSRDIREFVGSVELAVHKIYSTEDQKYADLTIRPFGPTVMVFVTTEELPRTVKLIGQKTGIVVISAQDLAVIFSRVLNLHDNRWRRRSILTALRRSITGIEKAN